MTTFMPGWWRLTIAYCASLLCLVAVNTVPVCAKDIFVDPDKGQDSAAAGSVKTIRYAVRTAKPGDTIHLRPMVYREAAEFYGVQGEPDKPITLDGHGATLEGSDPLQPNQWQEVAPGLFRCGDLLSYIDDAIISRWFLLWNGRMVHMGRTSKGTSAPLKRPKDLDPGEWTFVKDDEKKMPKPLQIAGDFYLRLKAGESLSAANIFVPTRSAGVQFNSHAGQHNAHLVIRNLTATHSYNDGFNIHGHCEDVLFEDIRAIECGDDGISAHETAQYHVEGFTSIGNSTGICDTGASQTSYNRVFIRDCLAFDLYFLDTGRYSVTNAVVLSSAERALYVVGREDESRPCTVSLDNVYIRRMTNASDFRVSKNTVVTAKNVTLRGLNFQFTGGKFSLHDSLVSGVPALTNMPVTYDYIVAGAKIRGEIIPSALLWPDVEWAADRNTYHLSHLRFGKTTYTKSQFADFKNRTGQDSQSSWRLPTADDASWGANLNTLVPLVVSDDDKHRVLTP